MVCHPHSSITPPSILYFILLYFTSVHLRARYIVCILYVSHNEL